MAQVAAPKKPTKSTKDFLIDFLIGGISASISKTATAPLERVKLLMQISEKGTYTGIFDCFVKVTKQEGVISLWKGNMANIIRYFPTQALNFSFKDTFKKYLCPYNYKTNPVKFFFGNLASGGAAGASSLCVVYPLDFARTRLGADTKKEFTGIFDVIAKIAKSDGFFSLYQGFTSSIMGIIVYRACTFGGFDTIKRLTPKFDNKALQVFSSFCQAQFVTSISGIAAYPFDTVRRKLMMQVGKKGEGKPKQYKGNVDCFVKIYKKEGMGGFFKGSLSNIFRGVGSSLVLVLYDEIQDYLHQEKPKH